MSPEIWDRDSKEKVSSSKQAFFRGYSLVFGGVAPERSMVDRLVPDGHFPFLGQRNALGFGCFRGSAVIDGRAPHNRKHRKTPLPI